MEWGNFFRDLTATTLSKEAQVGTSRTSKFFKQLKADLSRTLQRKELTKEAGCFCLRALQPTLTAHFQALYAAFRITNTLQHSTQAQLASAVQSDRKTSYLAHFLRQQSLFPNVSISLLAEGGRFFSFPFCLLRKNNPSHCFFNRKI